MRRKLGGTNKQAMSRARVLAVTLMLTMVASLLALIREAINPRVGSVPEQLLFAGLVFVPFLSYLALAIQVRMLLRRSKDSLEAMPPLRRAILYFLGPFGFAWAVFELTREEPASRGPGAEVGERDR